MSHDNDSGIWSIYQKKSSFEPAGYVKVMAVCEELEMNLTHTEKASEELVEAVVRGSS